MGFLSSLFSSPSLPTSPPIPPAAHPSTLAAPAVAGAGANQKAAAAAAAIQSGMNPTNPGTPTTAASKLLGAS